MLVSSSTPLCHAYDLAMLDLDGVVYVGDRAVPAAAESLQQARAEGMRVAFITNNASRTPERVAEHLQALGIAADPQDVVTSAQAAARVLLDRCGPGARVAVLGAAGLQEALQAEGLVPLPADAEDVQAVVSGYDPDRPWRDVMRVAARIREGLFWVASNTDRSIPTAYGSAPGHGVLVDALRAFSGVEPVVAGKPERPLLEETLRRVGSGRPLMVGDRLDTDIAGAHRVGVDSLLVLTGVTGLQELSQAPEPIRPTYLAPDLTGLLQPQPVPSTAPAARGRDAQGEARTLGGWTGGVEAGRLVLHGAGQVGDWWRVVAVVAWDHLDRTGQPADVSGLRVPDHAG